MLHGTAMFPRLGYVVTTGGATGSSAPDFTYVCVYIFGVGVETPAPLPPPTQPYSAQLENHYTSVDSWTSFCPPPPRKGYPQPLLIPTSFSRLMKPNEAFEAIFFERMKIISGQSYVICFLRVDCHGTNLSTYFESVEI